MAFDLGSAQDVVDEAPAAAPVKRKFDLASAQDVTDGPAEQPGAIKKYAQDYVGGVKEAFSRTGSDGILDSAKDGLQGLASVASSVAAPVAALPRFLGNRFGLTDAPEETYAQARDRFTYTPDDEGARGVADTFGAAIKPVGDVISLPGKGAGKVAGAVGASEEDVQNLEGVITDSIGLGLGARGAVKKPGAKLNAPEIANTPEQVARAAGLKILPSQAKSAPIGTVAETLAGSSRLAKKLAGSNAEQVANLLAEELGLPKGTKLTPEQFAKLREPLNGAYQAVSDQLGTLKADAQLRSAIEKVGGQKGLTTNRQVARLRDQYSNLDELPAAQVVQEIRSLREKASSNLKTPFETKDRVNLKELGKAQQEIANALDDMLERGANASGKPELVKAYKEARVALAKVGTVERAVNAPSGAAGSLLKQQNKGAPLNGRLKVIADSARAFPEVMGKPPVQTGLEGALQTGIDVATGGLRPLLSKTLVNTALESNAYQNSIGRAAPTLGPGSALGAYFDDGSSGLPARQPKGPIREVGAGTDAGTLAGDLQLVDDPLPGAPQYSGPPLAASELAGDLGLTPEQLAPLLDDALRLTDESAPSRPIPRGSTAGDLAGDLQLAPDELSLTDDAPTAPQYVGTPLAARELAGELGVGGDASRLSGPARQGPPQPLDSGDLSLADQLTQADNVRIVPSRIGANQSGRMGATKPGQVDIMVGDERLATFDNIGLAEELLADINKQQPPEAPAAAPVAPAPKPAPGNSGASLADELSVEFDSKGHYVRLKTADGETAGFVSLRPSPRGGYQVMQSELKEPYQGKKQGVRMYLEALKRAEERGGELESDTSLTAESQRMYDALERRGADVTRNPTVPNEFGPPGSVLSENSLRPAFTAKSKGTQAAAPKAAAPKAARSVETAMNELSPHAKRGALVRVDELRPALQKEFPTKKAFDNEILKLSKEGKVQLQAHAWPGRLSKAEKESMIEGTGITRDGKGREPVWYDAIGIRME